MPDDVVEVIEEVTEIVTINVATPGTPGADGNDNLVVGPTNTLEEGQVGVWIQTFSNGDITMWVEDGQ